MAQRALQCPTGIDGSMEPRKLGYWAATGLLAAAFVMGGIGDLVHAAPVMEGMRALGYPAYFATILGTWKVLGALAILAPRFPRLKEWAYAGMVFDLTGAVASHLAVGEAGKIAAPIVLLGLVYASWALRAPDRQPALGTESPA